MKTYVLAVALMMATFVGCTTLPDKLNDKGVLAVGVDSILENYDHYYVCYRLYYEDEKYFMVYPGGKYTLLPNLAPGKYTISSIEQVYIGSFRRYSKATAYTSFTIEPNKISILDKQVRVRFILDSRDGVYKQNLNFASVSNSEREKILAAVSKEANASLWEFSEAE